MNLLLDTSILVDVLRAKNRRREFLAELVRAGHTLSTTVLNIAELYVGMRQGEEQRTEGFLAGLVTRDLTPRAARLAGHLKNQWSRKGRTLTLIDCLIAAVAIETSSHFLTDNHKDFPMPELTLFPLP